MRHIELRLNTLKRPKLMLEAACNGLASYDPSRHLPVLLGGSLHRSKPANSIVCWTLKRPTTDCAKKSALSIPQRATSDILLPYWQNTAVLKRPKDQRPMP
jgi:hypothetical protein